MMFGVRQKVVCVDADSDKDGWTFWREGVTPLKNGQVYTVFRGNYIGDHGEDVIQLVEAENPFGYFSFRFRPIVELKTEISFTAGADPSTDQFDNRRKVRKKVLL